MRPDIHPAYNALAITCSCGNAFETRSALPKDSLYIDVCSKCHPFYTGQQKNTDVGGRIDKFKQRFGASRTVKRADAE